jgi:hypothetical protein
MRLSDLEGAAWERNPRVMDRESSLGLRRSLQDFGDLSGIVLNTRNGKLVCGHQRVRQLADRYASLNPVVEIGPGGTGAIVVDGASFAVRLVDWDEETHAKANIAANNPKIQGEFEQETLAGLLLEMASDESFAALRFDSLVNEMPQAGDVKLEYKYEKLIPDMECRPYEHYDYLLVVTKDQRQWEQLLSRLQIKDVVSVVGGAKRIGLGRAIFADRVLQKLMPPIPVQEDDL